MKKNIYRLFNILSYLFFIYVISEINIENLFVFKELITKNYLLIFLALAVLVCSNLLIGFTWSIYIRQHLSVNIKISLLHWLNSYKAKYVPGKITSPLLRISDDIYAGNKKDLFFSIFLENIYLAFSNLFLGFYIFVSDIYSFFVHLLLYLFINCLIYLLSSFNLFNFSFKYFKNIFLIQFINIFYLCSVYMIIVSIEVPDAFKLTLLYLLVAGVSMFISIFPAGIGIREYGVLEMSKILKLRAFSIELLVLFVRVFTLFGDFLIILFASFLNSKK